MLKAKGKGKCLNHICLLSFYKLIIIFIMYFTILKLFAIIQMVIILKILFKNKTKYNEEIYTEFLQFHQKIYGFRYSLFTVLIIGLLLFLVIMQVKFHKMDLAIIVCFAIVGFFLWRLIHPTSIVSKEFNSDKIKNEQEFTFTFYDKRLKLREENNLKYYVIAYRKLYRVFETNSFFYLYIDKTHAFLIKKDCFSIGNSKDFSEFIHKKCRFKYRYKFKNK